MSNVTDRITRLSASKRALLESRLNELGLNTLIHPLPISNLNTSRETTSHSTKEGDFPRIIYASNKDAHLATWISHNRNWLQGNLRKTGAILFRDFLVEGAPDFEQCIAQAFGEVTDYPGVTHGVILRKHIHGKIYTSTEYSPEFIIHLHNECAFANHWPAQICFFCVKKPENGGETPIANSRRVLSRINLKTLDRLTQLQILYVRNFGYGLSRSWEQAFGTKDKDRVEKICLKDGVTFEWLDSSRLRTFGVRPPVAHHPITGERVWFNHINSSHISSLDPELRYVLLSQFGPKGLPRNCYYGDGSDFESNVIEEIREAYKAETVTFSWRSGDVLMLDNMLTAHGRLPFKGQRQVLVGMSGSIKRPNT